MSKFRIALSIVYFCALIVLPLDLFYWRPVDAQLDKCIAQNIKSCVIPWTWWDPLTDDGDALRLAVKLELLIDCDRYMNEVVVERDDMTATECLRDTDPYAATRRAIVRAAAEIGKAKKQL